MHDPTPQAFPRFADLPKELRLQIWEAAVSEPTMVQVTSSKPTPVSYTSRASTPPMLLASREAYDVVVRQRRRAFRGRSRSGCGVGRGVLAGWPTELRVDGAVFGIFVADEEDMDLVTHMTLDVGGVKAFPSRHKLREVLLRGGPRRERGLRRLTVEAARGVGILAPELQLLGVFCDLRWEAVQIQSERPGWRAPEVSMVVRGAGAGPGMVVCRCDEGLLGLSTLRWDSSPGVRVSICEAEVEEIMEQLWRV